MSSVHPKYARRIVLELLYKNFLEDPLRMLSAADVLDDTCLERESLAANAYYLYDRKLVEMMVGYNPPLFAAIRISPEGIDLVEDTERFDRMFPVETEAESLDLSRMIPLMMELADQAERASIDGVRKEWLLRDVTGLREALQSPESRWDTEKIWTLLRWLEAFVESGSDIDLPAIRELQALLSQKFD
jgi:hypothetical protein